MAQATLLEMAREVYLYSGEVAPILLCKRWVRDRYRKICDKNIWSFKLNRSTFGTPAAYSTGTITMTNGSAVVTGSSTAWLSAPATLVGQQLKVNGVVFTVLSVATDTSLTVDQPWLSATQAGLTYIACQAYITPTPTDFHAFYSVIDPFSSWRLHLGFNSKELDRIDSRRSSTGVPYILANGVYNNITTSTAIEMYELWPNPLAQRQYMYTYERRVNDLTDNDVPPGIIRSDILIKGALSDLARWPGTPEKKNPMFDPQFMQWRIREAEFKEDLDKAMVEDNSIMQNDLSWGRDFRYAPIDANFMQTHAFPSY